MVAFPEATGSITQKMLTASLTERYEFEYPGEADGTEAWRHTEVGLKESGASLEWSGTELKREHQAHSGQNEFVVIDT